MPIYDYHCSDCDATREVFVQGGETPECPACNGNRLEKLISTFSVGGQAPPPPPPGCGGGPCAGPAPDGTCGMQ